MVREIVEGIHAIVPKDFVIGVKINSADYVETGERPSDERVLKETRRVLDHIRTIAFWGMVDFIEISGGDYESPGAC
jgi:2,4-dienoyl-CoA reductase-like NADH-dependent reductase (Old Yellow Enzyme family)